MKKSRRQFNLTDDDSKASIVRDLPEGNSISFSWLNRKDSTYQIFNDIEINVIGRE